MQRWTPQHAKFVGRVIFANFLSLPLKKYESIVEEVESLRVFKRLSGHGSDHKRRRPVIVVRRLSKAKTFNEEKENRSSAVVAKIETRLRRPGSASRRRAVKAEGFAEARGYGVASGQGAGRGNRFTIRYQHEGFNKMYVINNDVRDELCADKNIRSMLFCLRRISSRNALTHMILKDIIENQRDYLETGNPIDLVPFSQVRLTDWINRSRNAECHVGDKVAKWPLASKKRRGGARNKAGRTFRVPSSDFCHLTSDLCNSWVSRLVNGISVIIPSGEEKPLKSFFQTQKDVNKRLIKHLLDNENEDLESGALKKPLTDNQIKAKLKSKYGVRCSRHSVGSCRKEMGIPPAKRRLSGYKYPPLSANFSMLYPLVLEEVLRNASPSSGVYELRLNGKEEEYPNGKTNVIYIGSTRNIKKRLREHLGKNSKNGHIRDFLKNHDCSFRYIQFSRNWKEEEGRLYGLFVSTYGAPPKCNRVKP